MFYFDNCKAEIKLELNIIIIIIKIRIIKKNLRNCQIAKIRKKFEIFEFLKNS